MRIKMDLEEFDFTIEHIKGRDNVIADALSRISIRYLFQMYEETHVFKTITIPLIHKFTKQKDKKSRVRNSNHVLAFTRSMAKLQNNNDSTNDMSNQIPNTRSNSTTHSHKDSNTIPHDSYDNPHI